VAHEHVACERLETLGLARREQMGRLSGVVLPHLCPQAGRDGVEDVGVIRDAQKRAQRPQRCDRFAEQILVANRQEVVRRHGVAERRDRPDLPGPRDRRFMRILRTESGPERRQRDVAAVAHHVHVLGGWKQLTQYRQVRGVLGRLVSPARHPFADRELFEDGLQYARVAPACDGTHRAIDVEDEAEVPARALEEALATDLFEQPSQATIVAEVAVFVEPLVVADHELALGAEVDTQVIEQQAAHEARTRPWVTEHEDGIETGVLSDGASGRRQWQRHRSHATTLTIERDGLANELLTPWKMSADVDVTVVTVVPKPA